jgi:hypothetical protein
METAGKPVEEKPKEVKEEETRREEEKARRDALSEMIRYVRECMGLGYTTKQIKRELIEKGWPRKTINEIILMEVIRRRKEARSKESSETGKTGMKEMLVSPKP